MARILSIVLAACLALSLACGSSPQSRIVGKWEVESGIKITAEFNRDGTARLTMLGHTMEGTYKFIAEDELEWTVNGRTTRMKISVSATELAVTDGQNRTVKYKRK